MGTALPMNMTWPSRIDNTLQLVNKPCLVVGYFVCSFYPYHKINTLFNNFCFSIDIKRTFNKAFCLLITKWTSWESFDLIYGHFHRLWENLTEMTVALPCSKVNPTILLDFSMSTTRGVFCLQLECPLYNVNILAHMSIPRLCVDGTTSISDCGFPFGRFPD